jgi:hypothetical protein
MNDSRFSRQRVKFGGQIRVLDNLQLSAGIPAGTKKFENWLWTGDESTYVTSIRTQSDKFMDIINSQRHCPGEIKDQMSLLIVDFMGYDHGKIKAHRLLDKIALNGTVEDCEALGIKRGTSLAKEASHGSAVILASKVRATLAMRINIIGKHKITVRNEETSDSRALPEGIARARVFRYIGKEAPTSLSQYESVGNAKRGVFESNLEDVEPTTDKLYAWYICRYEDTRGNVGPASEVLKLEIYFPVL